MESAVIDLPEPDSPAMQRVSPTASSNERSLTTIRDPCGVATSVVRSRTARMGSLTLPSMLTAGVSVEGKVSRAPTSLKNDAREIERNHPIRLIDDFADPQVSADRGEHIGIDR